MLRIILHQRRRLIPIWLFCALAFARPVFGQIDYERQPINYNAAELTDPVTLLKQKLEAGKTQLNIDAKFGLLPGLLKALDISADSQTLVFTKTSFQIRKISPYRPRALYFNDEVYVGWVQGSDVIEIASTDARAGTVFYTLEAIDPNQPQGRADVKLVRDKGQCLSCHANHRTQGVPGLVMRSIYPSSEGRFVSGAPNFTLDHNSSFNQRWGGWYVTGNHGKIRHLGNSICTDKNDHQSLDTSRAFNVGNLDAWIAADKYLRPTSDIVALLLLEHQTQMHNLITRANFETRAAKYHDRSMNKILERPDDYESDTTRRRIAKASEKLFRYMMFADASDWEDSISGHTAFLRHFESQGIRDSRDRSLRLLDLNSRLLRYPVSYLIYTDAFDQLPESVKSHLGKRLYEVLIQQQNLDDFAQLSSENVGEIREILQSTKPQFWKRFVRKSP